MICWLQSLDIYRDGGSLSASFVDEVENRFTLLFPIRLTLRADGTADRAGYGQPVLESHLRQVRVSPVTGLSHVDWTTDSKPVAWEQAREILNRFKGSLPDCSADYAWVYPAMLAVAEDEGATAEPWKTGSKAPEPVFRLRPPSG